MAVEGAIDGVGLPFQEAIDFFRAKVNLPTNKWDDLRHGAQVRAFSVAGVTRDDMLADFRAAMDRARTAGTGYEAFRKTFDEIVDRTGWKFYARGKTEEARRAWRARIIYRTNMRTSYMAGRYQQMTSPAVLRYRPFWQYRHGDSRFPRPLHVALDGKVFAADDPIWKVIFPPNGWGCSCDVRALSQRELKRLGKSGPDPHPDWLKPETRPDSRTGQPEERWPGIDRGWEYNVGHERLHGLVPPELATPLPPLPSPEGFERADPRPDLPPPPPRTPVDPGLLLPEGLPEEDYATAFLGAFGADLDRPALWRDPAGGIVTIDRSLFEQRGPTGEVFALKVDKQGRGRYMRLLAQAVQEPDEIWADWALFGDQVALTRTYLKFYELPRGRSLFALFRWGKLGWSGVTGYDATASRSLLGRSGALLYRRRT
ncbi:PBECR2 nuclease fold domain-containing protein [Methylobrevis pamukkalensis]|uniref:Phage Mu protein F like protein n=1 Tax=Methylobrevis pamukkalensis TaxID=1439726 RepID=A0A1E3H4E5_9HYPH|nr:PBECR2 nuclease fold domain-containing protein [Methylobrevis pamukkalensis]ODN71184.1 Phage Mu protein F like protein [Methylobrevis pamukkalensis]